MGGGDISVYTGGYVEYVLVTPKNLKIIQVPNQVTLERNAKNRKKKIA
jgi:hypothetical protein